MSAEVLKAGLVAGAWGLTTDPNKSIVSVFLRAFSSESRVPSPVVGQLGVHQ